MAFIGARSRYEILQDGLIFAFMRSRFTSELLYKPVKRSFPAQEIIIAAFFGYPTILHGIYVINFMEEMDCVGDQDYRLIAALQAQECVIKDPLANVSILNEIGMLQI